MAKSVSSSKPTHPELAPDDIRRIREGLGLSQSEAGELLGGGPKAFTKYESGTIKPAASIANLLRLLEADPGALPTLTGRKARPMRSDMLRPFEVSGEHVAALSDRKLVLLTRRLLNAEAFSEGLEMDGIHVAANITVGDGGEDARIDWKNGPDRTRFLPSRLCQFQLKASEVSPAEAGADTIDASGAVKSMVRDAVSMGGTYIMMCSRTYTQKMVQQREATIRKRLADAGVKFSAAQIQFRDADQIADWVNRHPAVATWLLEQTQPGLAGPFRDWSHWSGRHEHESSAWVADDRLPEFRAKLRRLVSSERGLARVVGLSGLGKSRLTLEALAPTDEEMTSGIRLCDLVLYAVEQEVGSETVKTIVQNLADSGRRAIIVVDRCPKESHQDLAAMVKRSSSRLSLITIDHDVPPEQTLPDDTLLVKEAPVTVIEGMLKTKASKASDTDRPRLARLASGFPQLARLIGDAWLQDLTIASVPDELLFDRILLGRNHANSGKVKEAAMLISAFGLVVARSPAADELSTIATYASGVDAVDLRSIIDDLVLRGVAQMRGRLVTLQPRPIALHLAARQWRIWSGKTWDAVLFGDLPGRLRKQAAQQLALLNEQSISTEVVRHVCRANGPLKSIEDLANNSNAEVISYLAEIDAEEVITCLERLLHGATIQSLKKIEGDARRHLVRALETIAFVAQTFERAALLMLELSLAENETWGNNATGQFKALFPVLNANTEAPPVDRLRVIDELIGSNDHARMTAGVDALLAGAKADSFIRTVGAEIHGSRPALKPWQPKSWQEAWDYVIACADRLTDLAIRDDETALRARIGVARQFRSYVGAGRVNDVERFVAKVTVAHPYWPEALDSLSDILQYDRDGLDQDVAGRVENLVSQLTPKDTASRVRFIVTEMPWDYPADEKLTFEARQQRQEEDVDKLAVELLADESQLLTFFPDLSRDSQRMSVLFGVALAREAKDPLSLREPITNALLSAPSASRHYGLLSGFLIGLAKRDAMAFETLKGEASRSPDLAPAFAFASISAGLTPADVSLMCTSIRSATMPPFAVRSWAGGGELAKLDPEIVAPLFDLLLESPSPFYSIGLELMGMYVFQARERLEKLRPELKTAARNLAKAEAKRGGHRMDAHHFDEMIQWILAKGADDRDACAIALELARQLVANPEDIGQEYVRPQLPVLLSAFAHITWPMIGQAIVSDRQKEWQLQGVIGDVFAFDDVKRPMIAHLPPDMLFSWCHAHPETAPAFVAGIVSVLTHRNPNAEPPDFDPLARRLLDEFGDRDDVLRALEGNIHSFGWSGSRATYYALYLKPLGSLADHPIGGVRRWAKKMLAEMQREHDAAKDEDDEMRASWGE